jgi:hypothetical protein
MTCVCAASRYGSRSSAGQERYSCIRSRLSPRRCSAFSGGLYRFQPGGLLEPATDGSRGMVTTLPS